MTAHRGLPLPPAVIDILVALYEMEPATSEIIENTLQLQNGRARDAANKLVALGLASVAPFADALFNEVNPTQRHGRLPLVFRCTPAGASVAKHLQAAIDSYQRHLNVPRSFRNG